LFSKYLPEVFFFVSTCFICGLNCDTFQIRQMVNVSESGGCAFKDCLHVGEPGCAVKGDWERYPYYLQLLDEIKIREEIQLRLIGTKRESDVRYGCNAIS
jgi:hypothetical protein